MSSDENLGRRDFVKGLVGASAVVASGALVACSSEQPATGVAVPEETWNYEVDVAVLGGGASGLMAAAISAHQGMRVVMVEAGKGTGGTLLFSGGGSSRFNANWDDYLAKYPDIAGLPLPKVFFDTWDEAMSQFLRDVVNPDLPDVYASMPGGSVSAGSTYVDRRAYCDILDAFITDNGGIILRSTSAFDLVSKDNAVIGALAKSAEGEVISIKAKSTVICTGGFPANGGMMRQFYGSFGDAGIASCVPYNDGGGIQMGLRAGAKMTKGGGSSYGHHVPAMPLINYDSIGDPQGAIKEYEASDFEELRKVFVLLNDFEGVYVDLNLLGKRYCDEGLGSTQSLLGGYAGYVTNNEILRQPWGRAISVVDSKAMASSVTAGRTPAESVDMIRSKGGTVITADTFEELFTKLNEALPFNHQIPVRTAVRTMEEYNAAAREGLDALLNLDPPRTAKDAESIVLCDEPPFTAIPVTAGIMATHTGLQTDEKGAVLGNGTNLPIPGLYAAPFAAGGAMYYGYNSSSFAILHVLGYNAGKHAAEYAAS
ncbi:MAG: FAD-binding protein [Coriobacteriales bacterium]|jgi:hypothetical protein|nr:FAD-binding protein [Coriobacteriales bacterium]